MPNQKLFEEISNWKLEAKLEDSSRYFYHVKELDFILSGKKSYVIGRKGTGKTAIAERILRNDAYGRYSEKLSFKNFPFNEIYQLDNDSYSRPNQYISIWKYIIYSKVAERIIENPSFDPETRSKMRKIYGEKPKNIQASIRKWTGSAFDIKVLGTGFGFTTSGIRENTNKWIDWVDLLEDVFSKYLDKSKYFIIFDELDEDYKGLADGRSHVKYNDLLIGLFKAVQDVRSLFPSQIFPVIFLRDDIYDILMDADKNKWMDLAVWIEWDPESIRKLLEFRFAKAANAVGMDIGDANPWGILVSEGTIRTRRSFGRWKRSEIFDFILNYTMVRPRDFVKFFQSAANVALSWEAELIDPAITKHVGTEFSSYLRNELIDEVQGVIPHIKDIFVVISLIRKQQFTVAEFEEEYHKAFADSDEGIISSREVVSILFHFSILGNLTRGGDRIFKYKNRDITVNFGEPLVVHRGLLRTLQII